MDTHAIYEGAMRLLAAWKTGIAVPVSMTAFGEPEPSEDFVKRCEPEVQRAVDLAARTWQAAHQATGFTSKSLIEAQEAAIDAAARGATVPVPSADAFRSAGAV